MTAANSDALVFFGATGDLAYKQIFPAIHALVRRGRLNMPIVAIGRKDLRLDDLVARAKESIAKSGPVDGDAFAKIAAQLHYVRVDYDDAATFLGIREALGNAKHVLNYVALPPEVFEPVATNLAKAGLHEGARLVLEKPFGHDRASANALSDSLHRYFPEDTIFRIDHFLGKESVENLIYFRAANPLIETGFDREHVESVEITMAESFGVKGRAKFYDDVGAVRDVVQNHLIEVIACLAMDLPSELGHEGLRAGRSRLITQIETLSESQIVRGQVRGYADEDGVARGSKTETFAVLRFAINSPRWKGVPFFVRTGKSLPVTATEATVRWKRGARAVLDDKAPAPANYIRFRLGPDRVIAIGANVKTNGEAMRGESKELAFLRSASDEMTAYERLLGDAMIGDQTLFARKDAAEESWRVVDPIVGKGEAFPYDPGSWGPPEASRIEPAGGWSNPK